MTPKEKAKELVDKYSFVEIQHYTSMFEVKECALIAVYEIIQQCWDYRDIDLQASYDYWQEVKQEIQQL
jgi:predicted Co/Zn/Cd cation transporter (cation efflux family)